MEKALRENFSLYSLPMLVALFLVLGCTGTSTPSPQVALLNEKIGETEARIQDFDSKLQAASHDPGLKDRLAEEKALAESRLARLKLQRHSLDPQYSSQDPAPTPSPSPSP